MEKIQEGPRLSVDRHLDWNPQISIFSSSLLLIQFDFSPYLFHLKPKFPESHIAQNIPIHHQFKAP